MPIPQHLQRKLNEVLGPEAGEEAVAWIGEVETLRADVAELRHEMQLGFERIDKRFAQMETLIERTKSDLMKWSFVFWVGTVTSIAVLAKLLP